MSLIDSFEDHGFGERPQTGEIIAPGGKDVLPRLDQVALADAIRRLPEEELALALRSKLLPLISIPGLKLFAACGEAALEIARHDGLKLVAYAEAADFIAAARISKGKLLLAEATSGLKRSLPSFSASRRLTSNQLAAMASLALIFAAAAAVLPLAVTWLAVSLLGGLFFLSVIALRILCLLPHPAATRTRPLPLTAAELPVYTVLVPLFRETSVLRQLLQALTRLDYPPGKLDIKLILEESDILMQRAVMGLRLPEHFDVITVPCGLPQTKPRALNYALPFARGSLLTIYDAEDIPDPQQLRQAAEAFAGLPMETACLQAELVFDNGNENWLTRQFTIEYGTLFGILLPALAAHRLPLPLGGTSNHFRTGILRKVGAWDPYNVTEDADLGLRLARLGYDAATIPSRTREEANVKLGNWMRQRARWLKGFLATWLVHMRHPVEAFRDLGPSGFWTMQAVTLGVFASALLHPLCLAMTIALAFLAPPLPADAQFALITLAGLNLLVFAAGYGVTMILGRRALAKLGITGWAFPILTMPVYWLLMSAAAWLALWQFIRAPFHWNKTEHGLSRITRTGKCGSGRLTGGPMSPPGRLEADVRE